MAKKKCSCGDPRRKGMKHMEGACWTIHPPRPAYPKATAAEEKR